MNNIRFLLLQLGLLLSAMTAAAADSFTVSPLSILPGETGTLSLELANSTKYRAFETELTLPEGLSFVTADGKAIVELTERAPSSFVINSTFKSQQTIKLVCYSNSNEAFTGESGGLVRVSVAASSSFSTGTVRLENTIFTTEENKDAPLDNSETVVTAKYPLTATVSSVSREYGEQNPAFTITYSGFKDGDTEQSLSKAPVVSTTATVASPVGDYQIAASGGESDKYVIVYVGGTLTITKAPLTISAGNYTKKQGEAMPAFKASYEGFKNGENEDVLTTKPTITTEATVSSAPGDYAVNVSGAEASNYEITYKSGTLTVTAVDALILTAKSYTRQYGDANPVFGFDSTGADVDGSPEITCEATAMSPVGTYPIVIRQGSVKNYNVTYTNGTLTITKAPLTISAGNYTKKQGEAMPAFKASYEGFKNGENEDVLTTKPVFTTEATVSSAPGDYAVNVSGAEASNYEITYKSGTLTVTAVGVTDLDNVIYCNNTEATAGKQLQLAFRLKNSVKIRGFQFDLYLPDGFSVAKRQSGLDMIAMSTARNAKDNIDYLGSRMQTTRKNVYRVLASSTRNLFVEPGDDEILTLTLNVADTLAAGDYYLQIDSIQMSDGSTYGINLDDVTMRTLVTVKSYTMADVNNDGRVNVSDFTSIASYILGDVQEGFVSRAADLNGDGRINITDLSTLAAMILGDSGSSSAKAARPNAPRKAEEAYTDPSTIDNVIYLNDTGVTAGRQLKLSFRLKNAVAIRGFQFDLHLPEGFTVAKKANGQDSIAVSTARYANEYFDYLGSRMQTTRKNVYRVLAASTKNLSVQPGDDEILTLVLDVADSLAAGDYDLLTDSIQMSDASTYGINLDDMTFRTVVKVEAAFDGMVLDENSTTAPVASDGDVNVKAKLTIKGGEWTTICLPFAMTGGQTAEAFGSDVQIADYTGWEGVYESEDDENPASITVNFTSVSLGDGLKANHPYAIKTTGDISEFVVSGVTVSPETEPSVTTGSARRGTLGSFTGSYVAGFTVPAKSLCLDGGKFVYSTGDTKLKAFHAYFDFIGVTKSYGTGESNVSSSFGVTTGISGRRNAEDPQAVYSIGGVLVSKDGIKGLPKGVYIRNGRKVVVR